MLLDSHHLLLIWHIILLCRWWMARVNTWTHHNEMRWITILVRNLQSVLLMRWPCKEWLITIAQPQHRDIIWSHMLIYFLYHYLRVKKIIRYFNVLLVRCVMDLVHCVTNHRLVLPLRLIQFMLWNVQRLWDSMSNRWRVKIQRWCSNLVVKRNIINRCLFWNIVHRQLSVVGHLLFVFKHEVLVQDGRAKFLVSLVLVRSIWLAPLELDERLLISLTHTVPVAVVELPRLETFMEELSRFNFLSRLALLRLWTFEFEALLQQLLFLICIILHRHRIMVGAGRRLVLRSFTLSFFGN